MVARHLKSAPVLGDSEIGLSVIICFKNEAANLKQHLPLWCEQDYPKFELILIDDHSSDGGSSLVKEAMGHYPQLRLVQLQADDSEGKKAAQKKGILAAQHDALVFTDADCKPASSSWLRHLSRAFQKHDVVLGYGALEGRGLVGALSEYETVETVIRYWSYALRGNPYMGVGRNLAYRKSVVPALKALTEHGGLLSGDDDLTIGALPRGSRVGLLTAPAAFTYSPAPASWKAWWRQKTRHYSTAWNYSRALQFSLAFEGFLQLLFLLLAPWAFISLPLWVVFPLFVGRWLVGLSAYEHVQPRRGSKLALLFYPFLEMIWVLATTFIHLRNLISGPPQKW